MFYKLNYYIIPFFLQTYKEAEDELIQTHKSVMSELELSSGILALEEKRYEDAIEHFTEGAKLSSVSSMFNLGLCYELGLGTSVDYAKVNLSKFILKHEV